MSMVCDICGKSKVTGSTQRHHRGVAGKRWLHRAQLTKKTFLPNLQVTTLLISGKKQKMKVCAKCLKRIKKYGAIKNYSNIAVA